jgi:hypothetical protein
MNTDRAAEGRVPTTSPAARALDVGDHSSATTIRTATTGTSLPGHRADKASARPARLNHGPGWRHLVIRDDPSRPFEPGKCRMAGCEVASVAAANVADLTKSPKFGDLGLPITGRAGTVMPS